MLVVPASIARKFYKWTRENKTCLECYEALCAEFSDPDKFAREKEWFLAASQGETGTKSNLNTTVSSVPDLDDEELHKWSTATLTQKGVLPNEQQRSA
eukprot:scaffold36184_cov250-Skeletonema_dohrnii-CCMP3373.AAC.1